MTTPGYDPEEDKFAVRLYATSDPTVFRALFGVNMGDLEPGVYPEYDDPDNMIFVHGDASTGKNQELEALPGPMDVYSMVKGKYLSAAKEEAQQARRRKGPHGDQHGAGRLHGGEYLLQQQQRQVGVPAHQRRL